MLFGLFWRSWVIGKLGFRVFAPDCVSAEDYESRLLPTTGAGIVTDRLWGKNTPFCTSHHHICVSILSQIAEWTEGSQGGGSNRYWVSGTVAVTSR